MKPEAPVTSIGPAGIILEETASGNTRALGVTVSGDLVQQIDHNEPNGGPTAQVERWNLISRNTQAVVTGLYLYTVTSAMGTQTGKLVVIK